MYKEYNRNAGKLCTLRLPKSFRPGSTLLSLTQLIECVLGPHTRSPSPLQQSDKQTSQA